jgi:hypothetical protein
MMLNYLYLFWIVFIIKIYIRIFGYLDRDIVEWIINYMMG